MDEDSTDTRAGLITHTLWSETMLEELYAQLRANAGEDRLLQALAGVDERDMKPKYIVACVRKKLGDAAALRTERALASLTRRRRGPGRERIGG